MNPVSDVAFTPAVKAIQAQRGSRAAYAKLENGRGWHSRITPELAAFLSERDSFFFATANAQGQPYVQHRGGAKGLLKVLDEHTLGFADFRGNRQYITSGNLAENERAFIFVMDYAQRQRIKLWGRARVVAAGDPLVVRLTDAGYAAAIEQAIVFDVAAWDANCPKHIPQLVPRSQVQETVATLQARVSKLEAELARYRELTKPA